MNYAKKLFWYIAITTLVALILGAANRAGIAKVEAYHACIEAGYTQQQCDNGKAAEFYIGR